MLGLVDLVRLILETGKLVSCSSSNQANCKLRCASCVCKDLREEGPGDRQSCEPARVRGSIDFAAPGETVLRMGDGRATPSAACRRAR